MVGEVKMNELTSFILWNSFLFIMVFALGWASNEVYESWTNERQIDGFFVENITKQTLNELKTTKDMRGDWVCINSRGMTFDECKETAQHECGHEIFAEIIEDHPEKIEDIMEVIGK